jgi:ATP-binding protein involved in chromosome partitioning
MASKESNDFDADWGELDFMLVDLPQELEIFIFMQALPTGVVVVSTPQAVALADARSSCSEAINVPVLGIENMAYFTPEELPENKYYLLKRRSKKLSKKTWESPLGGIPIVQSIREAGDYGRPAAMQTSAVENIFDEVTRNVVQETVKRNENLPASEAVKITTMAGCSAEVKKNNIRLVSL